MNSGGKLSRRERVALLFRAFPDTWINDEDFMGVGGRDAWRTRISECRTQLGMVIDNRLVRHTWGVRSQYRYRPASTQSSAQTGLFRTED